MTKYRTISALKHFSLTMAYVEEEKKKRINFLCENPTHSKDSFILHNVIFEILSSPQLT